MWALKSKLGNQGRQRGVAVVECVIVLPVVLFIMLAVAEVANAILTYNKLTQTVRDASRYISAEAGAGSGIVQLTDEKIARTVNLVIYGKITAGGATVLPNLDPSKVAVTLANDDDVSVAVTYDYLPLFAPAIPGIGGARMNGSGFQMNTEIIMRVL
jgi:Flp pilus assembly protein TadG